MLFSPSGWGKFSSNETGSAYEGYWKDGLKVTTITIAMHYTIIICASTAQDGSGTLYLSNGDSFTGTWKQGLVDGPVTFKFSEKSPWNDPEY